MPSNRDRLVNALRILMNAAPEEFSQVVHEFGAYTNEIIVMLTDAPSDEILKTQGRALQMRGIMLVLEDATKPPRPQGSTPPAP